MTTRCSLKYERDECSGQGVHLYEELAEDRNCVKLLVLPNPATYSSVMLPLVPELYCQPFYGILPVCDQACMRSIIPAEGGPYSGSRREESGRVDAFGGVLSSSVSDLAMMHKSRCIPGEIRV